MLKPEYFFPIRISSYNTGALMIHAMSCADNYSFATSERPVIVSVLKKITPKMFGPDNKIIDTDVENALSAFNKESKNIIESAITHNDVALARPLELDSLNIYDARFYKGFLTSRIGLLYKENGETKIFKGLTFRPQSS